MLGEEKRPDNFYGDDIPLAAYNRELWINLPRPLPPHAGTPARHAAACVGKKDMRANTDKRDRRW